jgi:acetyl-CoA carboxylase biotin carboxyl carrier protein
MKKPSGPRTGESARSPVEIAAVEQLAKLAVKYDLSEVDINLGELRVRLGRARAQTAPPVLAPAPAQAPANAAEPSAHAAVEGGPPAADLAGTVKSPMVGTAYLRPSPEAKPFVEVGAVVKEGDKLMLVEAMKTFNDIVATRAGTVVDILVVDGSPVEYNQPLMVIG